LFIIFLIAFLWIYTAGQGPFSIYWSWSYPQEANRDVTELDNRFSKITEIRRVAWPDYEGPEWSEREFLQGIAASLELFHSAMPICLSRSTMSDAVAGS
jgi:hypothetical protein